MVVLAAKYPTYPV